MALPSCAQLREAYANLALKAVKQVKVGDKMVTYQNLGELKTLIEDMCGSLALPDKTRRKGFKVHGSRFVRKGCESPCDWDTDC